jgi:hypothetical protein
MSSASDLIDEQWALPGPAFNAAGERGPERVVAVDVTGPPVGAPAVPASTHGNRTSEVMLEHLTRRGVTERLDQVLVDRGVTGRHRRVALAA